MSLEKVTGPVIWTGCLVDFFPPKNQMPIPTATMARTAAKADFPFRPWTIAFSFGLEFGFCFLVIGRAKTV